MTLDPGCNHGGLIGRRELGRSFSPRLLVGSRFSISVQTNLLGP